MRICIYGAGAIGAWLGVQLSLAGKDVTLVARGPHLEAMQKNGVKLLIDGEERIAHPRCIEDPADAGPQDYVIITLKAHSLPGIADKIQPLLGPDTAVVTGVNGIFTNSTALMKITSLKASIPAENSGTRLGQSERLVL